MSLATIDAAQRARVNALPPDEVDLMLGDTPDYLRGPVRGPGGAVLLDKKGRPEMPAPFDKPGMLYSYVERDDPHFDYEDFLWRLPENIREKLRKGEDSRRRAEDAKIPNPAARGSIQSWEEVIYNASAADGTPVTGSSESTMVPIFTLPANYFYVGRTVKWTVFGRQSTAITTPGTITFKLSYSASGTGAVQVATSGAFAPDVTAAATNLTFMLEWWTWCRAVGASGTLESVGRIEWTDYDDASAAALVANLNMRMAPTSAPAVATCDTTVARALNPTYTSSVTTGSMTAHAAFLEAMT